MHNLVASELDCVILTETRECQARQGILLEQILAEWTIFSSGIGPFSGGIAIWIRSSFLQRHFPKNSQRQWSVLLPGRLGMLKLFSPKGCLTIIAVYLHPSDTAQKMHALDTLANLPVASLGTVFFGGDWNFVTANHDRFCRQTLAHTGNKDATLAKRWRDIQHALHLVELHQDHHTFASSLTFSRIDRIYTNLHPAIHMFHQLFAHVLDKVVGVSDHYPVLFGIRAAEKHSRIQRLPSWLVRHPCFTKNFQEIWEWKCDCLQHERVKGNPFDWLLDFKSCARQAGKITRRQLQNMSPRCLEEKIAIIGSFIAFTLRNDDFKAHQMASRLDILRDGAGNPLTIGSAAFNALLDEYLENTHRQIETEMQSLQDKRHQLTDFEVAHRKHHLWKRLQRMMPGNSVDLTALRRPNGSATSNQVEMAELLTEHWQKVFDEQPTDAAKRRTWIRENCHYEPIPELEAFPTMELVDNILWKLPKSAPGPDGIPFELFAVFPQFAVPIFWECLKALYSGSWQPDSQFNAAFLMCIAKKEGSASELGVPAHWPSDTRPLSIVDSSNRILATCLLKHLEKHIAPKICSVQRGFISDRHMLQNILDMDYHAQCASLKFDRAAMLLFDFKAAFPSLSHNFLWEILEAWRLPRHIIRAIQSFYQNNSHTLRLQGATFPSLILRSGVRQGCPLSPLLFNMATDALLRILAAHAPTIHDITRAYADDTASITTDWVRSLPYLSQVFCTFADISALNLNVNKTVFIPLWPNIDTKKIRTLLRELCPFWKHICIATEGRYLGIILGPEKCGLSWKIHCDKYIRQLLQWCDLHVGTLLQLKVHKTFLLPILTFVLQLLPPSDEVARLEQISLHKILSGPGNWILLSDAQNLKSAWGFPIEFPSITFLEAAVKIRVWVQAAKDAEAKCKQLEHIWFNASRHHFPAWHTQALYRNVWNAVCFARSRKIDVELIVQDCFANNRDLQRQLYKALLSSGNATYFPLYRLRSNLKRWRLQPFGDISCRRARNCLNIISKECPPRVWFAVFRAMWNGWITSRRMRTMPGFDMQSSCKLGCPDGADELEHYCVCNLFWSFLCAPWPTGLSFPSSARCKETFFFTNNALPYEDICKLATAIHALQQFLVHSHQYIWDKNQRNVCAKLRLLYKQAAAGARIGSSLLTSPSTCRTRFDCDIPIVQQLGL